MDMPGLSDVICIIHISFIIMLYHAVSIVFVDSIRIQGPWLHGSMKPGSPSCCRRPQMEHAMERK